MHVNERASGSLNNWPKTFGLAVGPLAAGPLALPLGWNPKHVDFTSDPVRYLGIFLGSPPKVARQLIDQARLAVHDHLGSDLT